MRDESKEVIQVSGLSLIYKERDLGKLIKGRGPRTGVEDINFSVREGEIFSMIGLNGAGKTTVLKSILGLLTPDTGEVKILGSIKPRKKDLERIGYLPEISYYPQNMRLQGLLRSYGELYGMSRKKIKERVDVVLKLLGLEEKRNEKLSKLSKGNLQKVGIAQSILNEPKILFFDEPMSGLDPYTRNLVVELMLDLKKMGTTIFFNTHILDDVERVSDRVAIMNHGRLVDVLDMKELKNESKTYEVATSNERIRTNIKNLEKTLKELRENGKEPLEILKGYVSLREAFFKRIGEE